MLDFYPNSLTEGTKSYELKCGPHIQKRVDFFYYELRILMKKIFVLPVGLTLNRCSLLMKKH